MEWNIDYLEKDGIIFVKLLNSIGLEQMEQLFEEVESLTRKHNAYKYLIDHRGVEVVITVLDIDNIPDMLLKIHPDFKGKGAVLLDPSLLKNDLFIFLKNVLVLASMQLELFTDEDEALAWLRAG
jgi:hypothetical protein